MRNMGVRLCGVDCGEMASVDGRGGDVDPSSRGRFQQVTLAGRSVASLGDVRLLVGEGEVGGPVAAAVVQRARLWAITCTAI